MKPLVALPILLSDEDAVVSTSVVIVISRHGGGITVVQVNLIHDLIEGFLSVRRLLVLRQLFADLA